MKKIITHGVLVLLVTLFAHQIHAQTVTPYLTKGDKSQLLQQQSPIDFSTTVGTGATTITLTPATTYQTMDGFGLCLTEGSAEVIATLNSTQKTALLNELINPTTGAGMSIIRISIGASDLSSTSYSYNETTDDVNMSNFSLTGPDLTYLIPILKEMLVINPNLKILATPWSAPRWMKSNNGWIGGNLQTKYYDAYANYFVKYFQAMEANGIKIWAITPQNEPENPGNEPSMTMNSTEAKNFINNSLGPKMATAGFSNIKIIAFDHNCDNTAYPIDVLNNSTYVDGAAFHLYAGDISALSTVKNATNKNVYFTEQYTGAGGNFSGDFGWHMQNVVLGSINNWSKAVIEWNIATNPSYGPKTPGGCTTCQGAFTISNASTYSKNVSYYIISQLSKVVQAGAVRIGASSSNGAIPCASFKNDDGSMALIAYNSTNASVNVKVVKGDNAFLYSIPAASAVSFKWTETPPCAVAKPTNATASPLSAQSIKLSWTDNANNESAYNIKRYTTQGGAIAFETSLPANSTSFTDINLTSSTKYYYTIGAVGSCTNETTVETTTLCGNVQQPYNVVASAVPGIIEAEYFDKNGCPGSTGFYDKSAGNTKTYFRTSEDVDIEQIAANQYAIGWIEMGEWVDYTVDVATTGTYTLKLVAASDYANTIGSVDLKDGANTLVSLPITRTNGWTTYQTFTSATKFSLTKGVQVLRLYFNALEFNFDSFQLSLETAAGLGDIKGLSKLKFSVFPNPATEKINVVYGSEIKTISLTDVTGKKLFSQGLEMSDKSENTTRIDAQNLNNGVYFITLASLDEQTTQKIIVSK